jgi:hypothetical protein
MFHILWGSIYVDTAFVGRVLKGLVFDFSRHVVKKLRNKRRKGDQTILLILRQKSGTLRGQWK